MLLVTVFIVLFIYAWIKKNRNSRIAITACNCRFHENCIVDWLKRQEDNNIFTRSCFNSCLLAVPLRIENTRLCADSEKCQVDQTNDRTEKSQPLYEDPALTACSTGNLELLKCEYNKRHTIILEHFKSAIDNNSYSLIFMAIKESHLEIVKFLSGFRCHINFPNGIDSALHIAVQHGHLETEKHLLLSGSNIKLLNSYNKTAF